MRVSVRRYSVFRTLSLNICWILRKSEMKFRKQKSIKYPFKNMGKYRQSMDTKKHVISLLIVTHKYSSNMLKDS